MKITQPYGAVIPYLNVPDGAGAITFYQQAFGADLVVRIERDGGKLAHAELKIGPATFMIRDAYPEYQYLSPETVGGVASNLLVYVEDVHAFANNAAAHGAEVVRPVSEQFHGDLLTELTDPFGHSWFFATRTREMTPDELREQADLAKL